MTILTNGSLGEVQEVQASVECLVSSAHEEQHHAVCVIQFHDRIRRQVHDLVTRLPLQDSPVLTKRRYLTVTCLLPISPPLEIPLLRVMLVTTPVLRVQVYPVTGNVDGHAQLEPEGECRIEQAQCDHQAHRADPIGQLIQDRAEFRALVVVPRCVAVYRIQQRAHYVAP